MQTACLTIRCKAWAARALPRPCAVALAGAALAAVLGLTAPGFRTVAVAGEAGRVRTLFTRERSQDRLLAEAGLAVEEGDRLISAAYPGREYIARERPLAVSLAADGAESSVTLTAGTVSEALAAGGVTLSSLDYTVPSLHTPLHSGQEIAVHRVVHVDNTTTEPIPFETETVYTSLYFRNRRRTSVIRQGSEGEYTYTWRERWVDGAFESRRQLGVQLTREPVNAIVQAYGAGAPVSHREGPNGLAKPSAWSRVLTGRATGYSSSRGRGAAGALFEGTCAVNPNLIPYGSLLWIESTDGRFVYGYAVARDTGTALMAGHGLVDLYYDTYEEALLNGVIEVNVYVVG